MLNLSNKHNKKGLLWLLCPIIVLCATTIVYFILKYQSVGMGSESSKKALFIALYFVISIFWWIGIIILGVGIPMCIYHFKKGRSEKRTKYCYG